MTRLGGGSLVIVQKSSKPVPYSKFIGPAGVAASMAASITHPLDLTKIRMQTLGPAAQSSSMLAVMRVSLAESGLRSFYTGLSASLLRQMSYTLVRLGSYEEMKRRMSLRSPPTTGKLLLAAAAAGALGGIAGNPADILLVRMASDSLKHPEQRYGYRNALTGLMSLLNEEGVKGICRGLGTNTVRFKLYDFFKTTLLKRRLPIVDCQFHDNFLLHFVASLAAATCGTSTSATLSSRASPVRVLIGSLRDEGPMFMFKGWTPAFMRLGPNTVLMFVFYEQLKSWWSSISYDR
ncbi:mitochondrial carrier [Pisolithus thermaeus]|nr:mitochondrial carrier [Pisolithus thermaeus]